jgi:hypothetical protein
MATGDLEGSGAADGLSTVAADASSLVQQGEVQDAVRFAEEDVEVTMPNGEPGGADAPDSTQAH